MCTRPDNPTYRRYDPIFFYYLLASFAATYDDCPPTFPSNLKMRLKLREITGDMYQRSRPAIVSDEKKKRAIDDCAIGEIYVQHGRLLAYA